MDHATRAGRLRALARGGQLVLVLSALAVPVRGAGQETGQLEGRVVAAESGAPVAGALVSVEGSRLAALTDDAGRFLVNGVPPGRRVVVVTALGRAARHETVAIVPGDVSRLEVRLVSAALPLNSLVVSATREARPLALTPATIGVITGETLRGQRPIHPSELLGKVPGVWVNVTGGEGHMTALRQPLTTDPVYLYLENGVPTRSTGFFNHNALYEINVPQAERIEVVKGPASALYGSDAIGGVINVETRPAMGAPGMQAAVSGGPYGYARLLGSYALTGGGDGLRADLNLTRTDGWREATGYDRQTGTLRWDHELGEGQRLTTVASYSRIHQQTAGSTRLPEAAYRATPTVNLTPISYRDVTAARLTVAWERLTANSLASVTPFARYNVMDILPNWSLTYDPATWRTANRSLGFLARYRHSLAPLAATVIGGVDVDWSPGEHFERAIAPSREAGVFTAYSSGAPIYDYDVTFLGISPYLHAEASPLAGLRLTAALRFDRLAYAYRNRLGALESGPHRRPASDDVAFSELSPKLGATFDLGAGASAFVSYGQGFRAPSEAQLFRQGSAANTIGLLPVEADNYEAGVRGAIGERFRYELSAYRLAKHNDILSYQRPDDVLETRNAGETRHRGIELGLSLSLADELALASAVSYAEHTYQEWRPEDTTDLAGHVMESAPRTLGTSSVDWRPRGEAGPRLALEWVHLGEYWLDAANQERYPGHDLFNLQGSLPVHGGFTVFARLSNLADRRYAETAGWSAFRGRELAPGMPRALYLGAQLDWSGR